MMKKIAIIIAIITVGFIMVQIVKDDARLKYEIEVEDEIN